jgi:hypothetical protein
MLLELPGLHRKKKTLPEKLSAPFLEQRSPGALRKGMLTLSLLATAHPGFYRRTHTYLDKDQVMAYDPAAGSYSVLQMIRGAADDPRRSGCQTFNPMPLRRGELPAFRKHTYLGEERLLEVDPQNGDFRVLCFNRTVPCSGLDTPDTPATFGQVVQKGRLLAFVDADLITSVGQDEVLIQNRAAAAFSIRMYDRNADLPPPRAFVEAQALRVLAPGEAEFGQPFPGEPVASGLFGRPSPLSLMYAGKGLLLGYSAGGPHWSLWSYDRTATGRDSSALRLSRSGVWSRNVSRSGLNSSVQRELTYLGNDLVLEYEPGSCGYTVWPLLRAEQLPYASSLHTDPLRQSAPPLDAGSFCRPACSGTCASAADGSASCGWCKAPRGGATGGAGSSTSATGPQGALHGGTGLATLGSAAGSCYCSCSAWHWQGAGCPAEAKPKGKEVKTLKATCPAHRTCSSCLGESSCAWCGSSEQCFSRQAQSGQVCGEWHDLTCPMVPTDKAFALREPKPCTPRASSAGSWDLALLQLPEGVEDNWC